jgi:DNA-binding ferritin-like protein (Dps family)
MSARVVISISYGADDDAATFTRSTHLMTFEEAKVPDTEVAKKLADGIIGFLTTIVDDTDKPMFGIYKEEFPATVNPNPAEN